MDTAQIIFGMVAINNGIWNGFWLENLFFGWNPWVNNGLGLVFSFSGPHSNLSFLGLRMWRFLVLVLVLVLVWRDLK